METSYDLPHWAVVSIQWAHVPEVPRREHGSEYMLYKYLLLPLCKHIYIYEVARAPNLMKGIVREGKFSEWTT